MTTKKILFLLVSTELGGAEQSLLDILRYFKTTRNEELFVLAPLPSGSLIDEIHKLQIPVDVIPMPNLYKKTSRSHSLSLFIFTIFGLPSFIVYFFKIFLYTRKLKPDVIHSTGIKNHMVLSFLSLIMNVKIIIHIRDYIKSFFLISFFNFFKNRANIFWVSASNDITTTLGFPIKTYYCGFSTKKYFKTTNRTLRDSLRIPEYAPLIGVVGILTPWKGQREFILAAQKVLKTHPHFHFVIVGSQIYVTSANKNYTEHLHQLVETLNIKKNVHFLEFQKNACDVYNNLDLLVHCSTSPEPFGRVIVEGMLCKTPVIVANAGGAKEIVPNSDIGLLHEPKNIEQLAQKIIEALQSPETAIRVQRAYSLATSKFDYNQCFKSMTDYICNPYK